MRHYSHVCKTVVFSSHDVNFGEYVAQKDDVLNKFLAALAKAMERELPRVRTAFSQLVQLSEKELASEATPYESWANLAPNENRVLIDAAIFFKQVEEGGLGPQAGKTHVFHYCNLNEGRTVTWVHFVA